MAEGGAAAVYCNLYLSLVGGRHVASSDGPLSKLFLVKVKLNLSKNFS